jgi:hypothetical protein
MRSKSELPKKILKLIKKRYSLILSLLSLILLAFASRGLLMDKPKIKKIQAYFPFTFANELDPRSIFGVGEQVMAEHLFAFHGRRNQKGTFGDLMSSVQIDRSRNSVVLHIRRSIFRSDGSQLTLEDLCATLAASLEGTRHAPYKDIFQSLTCDKEASRIEIKFTKIPLNLLFLFTLPDFGIFDSRALPMNLTTKSAATGPYSLELIEPEKVTLKLNPFYPKELLSNEVGHAELINYKPSQAREFVEAMKPETHHLAYFFGQSLEKSDIGKLKDKGYVVETFPTEWFVYIILKSTTDPALKASIIEAIDDFRENALPHTTLGIPAYSISPSDREFSLSKEEYYAAKRSEPAAFGRDKKFKLATLETWAAVPFYARVLAHLKKVFPKMEVELIPPFEGIKLFTGQADVTLSLLGISHSDPLSHLSFLESVVEGFDDCVSKPEIAALSTSTNVAAFNSSIKEIERKINHSGLIVPIAHFPGLVAYRKDFIKDDDTSYGWGIQTWSFRVD